MTGLGRAPGPGGQGRAAADGRVRAPLDQACAVKVGEHAADRGEGQVQPGGQFPDSEGAAADLLERGDMPRAQRRGHGRGAVLPTPHSPGHPGKQLHQAQAQRGVPGAARLVRHGPASVVRRPALTVCAISICFRYQNYSGSGTKICGG